MTLVIYFFVGAVIFYCRRKYRQAATRLEEVEIDQAEFASCYRRMLMIGLFGVTSGMVALSARPYWRPK